MAIYEPDNRSVLEVLNQEQSMFDGIGHFHLMHRLIIQKAEDFPGAPLPAKYERGTPKECFTNAFYLATSHSDLTYCEGLAISAGMAENGWAMLMDHAWCIDPEGRVVDNTWDNPERCKYRGIKVPTKELRRVVFKKKTYAYFHKGVVFNYDMIFKQYPDLREQYDTFRAARHVA